MTASVGRRTVLGAAWAMPVVALAVSAPAAAASVAVPQLPSGACGASGKSNNGHYLVDEGVQVVVAFRAVPDVYEINVKYADGSAASFGTNYGTAPARNSVFWTVPLLPGIRVKDVQVHSFDDHYPQDCA